MAAVLSLELSSDCSNMIFWGLEPQIDGRACLNSPLQIVHTRPAPYPALRGYRCAGWGAALSLFSFPSHRGMSGCGPGQKAFFVIFFHTSKSLETLYISSYYISQISYSVAETPRGTGRAARIIRIYSNGRPSSKNFLFKVLDKPDKPRSGGSKPHLLAHL